MSERSHNLTLIPNPRSPPEDDTLRPVTQEEFNNVNADFSPHIWRRQSGDLSDEHRWLPTPNIEAFLDTILGKCIDNRMYDASLNRWALGSDTQGAGLVEGYYQLLRNLLPLWDTKGLFLVGRQPVSDTISFEKPAPLLAFCRQSYPSEVINYDTYVIPIEVSWLDSEGSFDNLRLQLGVYASRCLGARSERHSVSCIYLFQRSMGIAVFDRNGYHTTSLIHIHEQPKSFIYAIFCLTQPAPPIDVIHRNPRDRNSYMFLTDARTGKMHQYHLIKGKSDCLRFCGRATTAWLVRSREGQYLMIKRSWAYNGPDEPLDESEGMILAKVQGLSGVAQMLAYTKGTTGYNNDTLEVPYGSRHHDDPFGTDVALRIRYARIHSAFVTEYYSRSINEVENPRLLLSIFRDAIEGHRNLWNIGICHRDISPKNIRIKVEGNQFRGVLVGLDKAKPINSPVIVVPSLRDVVSGITRYKNGYQSMYVLSVSMSTRKTAYPSYLDDLESFFYVLCVICSVNCETHPASNTNRQSNDDVRLINSWPSEDTMVSLSAKRAFFGRPIKNFVAPMFGSVFIDLLGHLRELVLKYDSEKRNAWENRYAFSVAPPRSTDGYEDFIYHIDCALKQL
ncbi:hypothetical protein BDN70DRAFT_994482 [Pholiota conissans]|uniref:Fungal-type protein kinase domain-containing protein n=1 Tax=Pholiota conissans TaxID=109636 RepID=A0A9P5Z0V1_9AGAR|nr:hypothetical protein BDN70DRAFT_994482 [Pholiota conissans]